MRQQTVTFTRACTAIAIALLSAMHAVADAPAQPAPQSPLSAKSSLDHIVVADDLTVELVASEPNVIDPVAIRFDENGRLWVVEMRDYPMTEITGENVHSILKVLDDRDGDGFYESAAIVADDLRYATGLQPWRGGAIVTSAGKVSYYKDTNGDDKADIRETWYTGFSEANQQLRANHPRLGLDNHVYIANGLRGGNIIDARKPESKPISISGMDFRFDPMTRACEAVSGSGQFGLTFDDFGNRFICSNRNPAIHVVLENYELKQNPLVAVPSVVHDVAKSGADSRVYPIAESWTTSNLHAGQFTAACGVEVFRGDALPPLFRGNLFVCEPTAHLVHRQIMKPKGITFESSPAYDGKEFLASRDPWFSPVNLESGPDGALYIVDMYRAVIEHPEWMPEELKRRPDQLLGNDLGRIYRVVRKDFKRPPLAKLGQLPTASLADYLDDSNAWRRETAARLILERQDTSVVPALQEIANTSDSRLARIHALWLLKSLDALAFDAALLSNDDPRVIEQILRAAISQSSDFLDANRVRELTDHDDPRVRFAALFALRGDLALPPRHPADDWEMTARLIRAGRRPGELLQHIAELKTNAANPRRVVKEAARIAAATQDHEQISAAVAGLLRDQDLVRVGLTSLLTETSRHGMSLPDIRSQISKELRPKLDALFDDARRKAGDPSAPTTVRCDAIDLMAASGAAADILTQLALDDEDQTIRQRAIAALAKVDALEPWRGLLENFAGETPALQRAILDGLFVSADRTVLLLDAIESGEVKLTELDANRSKQLLNHADTDIKARAEKLLAAAIPADREQVLAEYQAVLSLDANPAHGRAVFEKNCASCHRIGDVGVTVAPDISDSRERLPAQLLTDILQPNRAIDSNFFSYTAITVEGLTHTGILAAETSNSVTLKQQEGKSITLLRDQIDELRSDGVSLMPDGLEKNIPPQDMADLIAFIKNWRYLREAPELAK